MPGRKKFEKDKPSKKEKAYWRKERERFAKERPQAYLQNQTVRETVKRLLPHLKNWRIAKSRATNAWLKVEDYLLDMKPGKVDAAKFKRMVKKAQKQRIEAIDKEQTFFSMRELLMRSWQGRTDFSAQQKMIALEYESFGVKFEREFFGHKGMLASAKLLNSFAQLIARMQLSKDKKYYELRQSVSDSIKAHAHAERVVTEHLGLQRYAFDRNHITWKKYYMSVLLCELSLTQQQRNIARAREALYSYLQKYAKGRRLNRFLAMLIREKRAEKNHLKKKENTLERRIGRMKGR